MTPMKLEVTTCTPTGEPRPTPLLFVHGAYSAAWVWDRRQLSGSGWSNAIPM